MGVHPAVNNRDERLGEERPGAVGASANNTESQDGSSDRQRTGMGIKHDDGGYR